MLRKVLLAVGVMAGIAGCLGCGNIANHYVYATIPVANQIAAFREDPNSGVLTQLAGSPYPVGDGAHSIVIHPSGKFLYVANPGEGANGEDDISLFEINTSNGGLIEAFPRTPLGSTATVPDLLVMDPSGNYLYVMNVGSNNISVFSISPTGTSCPAVGTTATNSNPGCLTQVAGSPFNIGVLPLNMQITPSGSFLYVTLASGPNCVGQNSGGIAAFSVSSGQLTLVDITCSDGINPFGLAIDPSGSYLYAANTSSNSIAIFSIGSTGVLTEVSGSPINDGYSSPIWMTFDPSGSYLYVANEGSSNITAFSITSTGLPAALTTSTTTNAFGAENDPSFITADPNGKFLFVGNQSSNPAIQSFSISNGSLTILTLYGVGNSPSSIAVLQ